MDKCAKCFVVVCPKNKRINIYPLYLDNTREISDRLAS